MTIRTPAFQSGQVIPAKYTCEGADISPPLQWTEVPAGAKSLSLIFDDPDAPAKMRKVEQGNLSYRVYRDDESAGGDLDCGAVCIHCWGVEADAVLRIASTPAYNEIVRDDLCDIYVKRPRHVDAARPVILPLACGAGTQEPVPVGA